MKGFLTTRAGAAVNVLLVTVAGFALAAVPPPALGGLLAVAVTTGLMFGAAFLKGTGLSEYGLQRPASWQRTAWLGVLYALVAFLLLRITLEPLLELWTGSARDLSRFDYVRGNPTVLGWLLVEIWVLAAFFEELYFRGFLINGIADVAGRTRIAWVIAVLLSCLLFAFLHGYQGPAGIALTGTGALFLSLVYLGHERNLWIPIIAHGLHDTSGMVFKYLGIYDDVVHVLF